MIEALSTAFASQGGLSEIAPLVVAFPVSNQLFTARLQGRAVLAKRMTAPSALYGGEDVRSRLELVARATRELGAVGLPVERPIAADDGTYVVPDGEALTRVFELEPGAHHDGSSAQAIVAAHTLARLHQEGTAALSRESRDRLTPFGVPYPLEATRGRWVEIDALAAREPQLAPVRAAAPQIVRAIQVASSLPADELRVVAHTDAHPRNFLFRDQAILIDLDNMVLAPRGRCAGFAALRFAFFGDEPRTLVRLTEMTNRFRAELSLDHLFRWMVRIEVEKVLRISLRFLTTGAYGQFLPNLAHIHLPNIELLLAALGEDSR